MAVPPEVDELLAAFSAAVREPLGVVALWVGGSLATGDYRPGVSDLDAVALVRRPLDLAERRQVRRVHRGLARSRRAAKLHCVYVPVGELGEVGRRHLTWAGGILFRRPLSMVARTELHRYGFAVLGPPPTDLLPAVPDQALRVAVRRELTGYWSTALRQRPWIWLRDGYVDLGLLTLARAGAALSGDGLVTKREALTRLDGFGVPAELVAQIDARRDGRRTPVPVLYRLRRACLVHRLMADGVAGLLAQRDPA